MTDELPPLPAPALPAGYYRHHTSPGGNYTADQMRAWGVARAAAAVAREREKIAAMFDANPNAEMFRQDIADAIRKGE